MYRKKTKGITFLETIVSIGIIGMFLLLSFPIMKIIYKTEIFFVNERNSGRNSSRIIEIIERDIKESCFGNKEYIGKKYMSNGKKIFEHSGYISNPLREEFFKSKVEKGNMLFLEIPFIKNNTVFSKYIIYRFYAGSLQIIECSLFNGNIFIENTENILDGVDGSFERDKKGIIITLKIRSDKEKIKKVLKGYEIMGKKYE